MSVNWATSRLPAGRGIGPLPAGEPANLPWGAPLTPAISEGRGEPAQVHGLDRRLELQASSRLLGVADLLGEPGLRPGIAGTAYDTAWLAGVPSEQDPTRSRFPLALQWLVDHQFPDGSWGGEVRYQHDRILSTLAALGSLASFGHRAVDRDCIAAGIRFLWQHGHLLASEPTELVGFELLLPTLVERAQKSEIPVPTHLDVYGPKRDKKLRLIPPGVLYSPRTTVVHSLEFLGDQAELSGLQAAQGTNGAIGNSPAATAFFLSRSNDRRALEYLQDCQNQTGGAMAPVLYPCETFELLWATYHLFLAGVPASLLLNGEERSELLQALKGGGVSLSPTFPIPDADDTAVALLLLHELGEEVDPRILRAFSSPDGYFVSFPYERHSSVGVNLHVLHALLRVPGYPEQGSAIEQLLGYLADQQVGSIYWLDKWHVSPYYATAHALQVLSELPAERAARVEPMVRRSREWLRQTQNPDGSWGFYGVPTAEETAYAVLGLAAGEPGRIAERDRWACAAGIRYLRDAVDAERPGAYVTFPPLWIDKCLYTPTLVVQAVIEAACTAHRRLQRSVALGNSRERARGERVKVAFAPAR